jgi:hypothetical protein
MRKPDPASLTTAARMYGGITRAMASTWATVGGVTSSSGMTGRVIRRHGLDAMTLSSTAAVMTRTRMS